MSDDTFEVEVHITSDPFTSNMLSFITRKASEAGIGPPELIGTFLAAMVRVAAVYATSPGSSKMVLQEVAKKLNQIADTVDLDNIDFRRACATNYLVDPTEVKPFGKPN